MLILLFFFNAPYFRRIACSIFFWILHLLISFCRRAVLSRRLLPLPVVANLTSSPQTQKKKNSPANHNSNIWSRLSCRQVMTAGLQTGSGANTSPSPLTRRRRGISDVKETRKGRWPLIALQVIWYQANDCHVSFKHILQNYKNIRKKDKITTNIPPISPIKQERKAGIVINPFKYKYIIHKKNKNKLQMHHGITCHVYQSFLM